MRIEEISNRLIRNPDGIYVSDGADAVSYSPTGHADCFQIEDDSFWFQHRNNCIAAMVAHYPYDGMLLDIGGGNGYVSQRLAADGHEVMLLEPGQTGAYNAHVHRGIETVACSLLEDAGFSPGAFGAIGMFDVIEHIEDDRAFIAEVAPLLAAAGKLYLTVPCYGWLWSRADVDAGHFRRHTERSLRALLDEHFEIDYLSYFFKPLVLPQWLLRALPYRLGLGRGTELSPEAAHGSNRGPMTRALIRLLQPETSKVSRGERIGFGASCLVAARRKPVEPQR
ncbi:MAG: methyltransferase domain-containing protein [Rhodanobacter sp.]